MPLRKSIVIPALLAAAIPVSWALAQGGPPDGGRGPAARAPSPEVMSRLNEGRIAMAKTALKLNDAQLKLWAPVEEQLRASFTARQKRFEEFRKRFEERRAAREQSKDKQAQPDTPRQRPNMAENLDRMSERMTQRAERMKAFAAAYKPFYESLSEEQKTVAGIVLRRFAGGDEMGRGRMGGHRRWAMEDGPRRGGPRDEQPRQ